MALALQNLQVCRKLCELLNEYDSKGERPRAVVQFFGSGSTPQIQSNNCGFIATPVIFTSIMDMRKFTAFFGFSGTLKRKKKGKDDFDVADLGLPYPSVDEFFAACVGPGYSATEFEEALRYLLNYANKLVVHFTTLTAASDVDIKYRKLDIACVGVVNAMHRLVYDKLRLEHPDIRFSEGDT